LNSPHMNKGEASTLADAADLAEEVSHVMLCGVVAEYSSIVSNTVTDVVASVEV
jgi:hypothetical protein